MLKTARALHTRARADAYTATNQDRFNTDEFTLSKEAILARHVSKHTSSPNSLCMGPCVHTTREFLESIQPDIARLYGPDRQEAIQHLASKLDTMPRTDNNLDPRLCEGTQMACVVARFQGSNDYKNLRETPSRGDMAQQVLKEAKYTLDLAKMVAASHVRELEAGEHQFERLDIELGGGGVPTPSKDSIQDFFRVNQLGQAPDTGDIRVALDFVTGGVAPRARTAIRTDLWSRWLHV
jgi:hypothetical protein